MFSVSSSLHHKLCIGVDPWFDSYFPLKKSLILTVSSKHPRPDGSWNVVNKQLYDVRPLTNWAVLNLCPTQVTTEKCRDFMIQMTNCCKALGKRLQHLYELSFFMLFDRHA